MLEKSCQELASGLSPLIYSTYLADCHYLMRRKEANQGRGVTLSNEVFAIQIGTEEIGS